jgi:hypothetical protein
MIKLLERVRIPLKKEGEIISLSIVYMEDKECCLIGKTSPTSLTSLTGQNMTSAGK